MHRRALDTDELAHLLGMVQDGVISRRQILELDGTDHDIARLLRRRDLTRLHRGVFVNHTGVPSWEQRAWGAVLVHWPAVLAKESALPSPPRQAPIQVAVDLRRTVRPVPGVLAHRTAGLDQRADWRRSPPRMRLEHAAIDVADAEDRVGRAFERLAAVCHTRQTDACRIRDAVLTRRGLRHRALLLDLLSDLDKGACSVLEREFLHRVERPHALPVAHRQERAAADGRHVYRDATYAAFGLVVELDGRAFHDDPVTHNADASRDLDAAVDSTLQTVRLTYRQVLDDGCRTAARLATLLRASGVAGTAEAVSALRRVVISLQLVAGDRDPIVSPAPCGSAGR